MANRFMSLAAVNSTELNAYEDRSIKQHSA